MEKRTFRNCRFYRSGDVLFADMEVFKGQGNNTDVLRLICEMCGCCDSTDLKIWTGNKKKMDFT